MNFLEKILIFSLTNLQLFSLLHKEHSLLATETFGWKFGYFTDCPLLLMQEIENFPSSKTLSPSLS